MGRVWLRARSACPPPFPVLMCGVGVRAGPGSRLCPAFLGWVVGACFLRFFFVSWFGFVVSVAGCPCPGPCGPCPPISFSLGWAAGPFSFRGVCLHVLVSLFPVGRCSWLGVAGFGWVVPLCLFRGPVFGAFWVGGLAASCGVGGRFGGCGLFSRPPPPPPPVFCFFFGGRRPACSSLCLPSVGARTGPHSVWSSELLLAVAFYLAVFRPYWSGGLCTRWARRPFLPGWVLALPTGQLRQAAACGSGLGGWGCTCSFSSAVLVLTFWLVRHRNCRARGGPVCGLRCRCVACWCGALRGVRWLALVSPSG